MFGNLDINDKHWKMSTIGESAKVPLHYGSTASAIDYDSETRYVRITDIDSDGRLNDDFKSPNSYNSNYLLNKGDILFARSGSVGTTYLFDEDYRSIFAGYLIRFIPDREKLDPEFAYQFTRSAYCQGILVGSKRGGVQKNVNAKQLSAIPVPLPPMSLQKEFVDFVHQVDKSKAICKKIFESFDNLVKSRFNELFGDCPKERLGNHCSTHARIGWQKLTKKEFLKTGDYYLVTGWDIMPDHRINFEQCYYVTKERYEQDQKLILAEGDVLLTKDGTIGKIGLIENTDKPATLNGHIFVIRSKDGTLLPRFLVGLFGTSDFKNQIESNRTGSTITGITQKSLLEFMIPIAPLDRQQEYVDFVKQVDKSKFNYTKKYEALKRLKESLICGLLIPVSNSDESQTRL